VAKSVLWFSDELKVEVLCISKGQLDITAAGHERLTNGKPALAHWMGDVETMVG
jgi:hypothetical protein